MKRVEFRVVNIYWRERMSGNVTVKTDTSASSSDIELVAYKAVKAWAKTQNKKMSEVEWEWV